MKFKFFITGIFIALLSGKLLAAEQTLDSEAISQLLKGNSISGVHYGKRTAQYFSESGLTLWLSSGDEKPAEGQWKIENDQYCSEWGDDNWNCFDIVLDEPQQIYYFIAEDFRAPFVSVQGFSLNP